MHLRVSTTEDLDQLFADLRPADLETINRMGGVENARLTVDQMILTFPHQIFVTDDGMVAALWIMLRKWDGVIEVIAYTGNAVEDEKAGFYRACLRGIDYIKEVLDAHKIECLVWGDYDRSIKWLERLGYKKEGYLRQHGPDKSDATLMGRIL